MCILGIAPILFLCFKWDTSLSAPKNISKGKYQMLVDIVVPAHATGGQIGLNKKPIKIKIVSKHNIPQGELVQIKYVCRDGKKEYWKLVVGKTAPYERVENGKKTYIEYAKGVVRVTIAPK